MFVVVFLPQYFDIIETVTMNNPAIHMHFVHMHVNWQNKFLEGEGDAWDSK